MREAIDYYHQLLQEKKFLTSAAELLHANAERLSVAGRPACNVLRPCFVTEDTYNYIQNAATLVMQAISILAKHLRIDAGLRKRLDLSAEEEEIVRIDSGYGEPDVSARLDGFLSSDSSFHFVEYNADSPGGIGYGDALSEVFSEMPVVKAFAERYPYRTIPVRSLTYSALLSAYKRWGGANSPNIAIIDWKGAATYNEFILFSRYFAQRGCAVKIGSPEDLEYSNRELRMGDFRIDLLYKRVLAGELLEKYGLQHPIMQAAREHKACVINGFAVQMIFKKALFALLTDPEYSSLFPPAVRKAIASHVPWTRKLHESKTNHEGNVIDLVPFAEKNREQLVLKPNGEYGGKGVVLGWQCTEAQWQESIANALGASYVLQHRVPVATEIYPAVIEGDLKFEERYFDLDPYIWDGTKSEGCGVRLSRLALLNVSAGGGSATPLFILT